MRIIPLTQGKVALVDDADYDWLNKHKWCAHQDSHTFYAVREIRMAKNKQATERMHRLILGLQPGDKRLTDHKDGNGLNNQRANLRICTTMQNQQSQRNLRVSTSKYKGVFWRRDTHRWRSQIRLNKKKIYLGCFDSEVDAAKAYDVAATEHYGEFALTNEMMGLFKKEGVKDERRTIS